ncbi:unnamed protein product [Ectocarpus sp. CCAP 1310/34]|nr:unnamed protein product [Ectocarpus sp. CCAP 1310/34]
MVCGELFRSKRLHVCDWLWVNSPPANVPCPQVLLFFRDALRDS